MSPTDPKKLKFLKSALALSEMFAICEWNKSHELQLSCLESSGVNDPVKCCLPSRASLRVTRIRRLWSGEEINLSTSLCVGLRTTKKMEEKDVEVH